MPKMIQIRHVPDPLHQRLTQRAARAGMSLSDYLRRELEQIARYPTWDDVAEQLGRLEPVRTERSSAELVRAERDAR